MSAKHPPRDDQHDNEAGLRSRIEQAILDYARIVDASIGNGLCPISLSLASHITVAIHDNEAELRDDPDDVDPRTYGASRVEAFTEAAHALDAWADLLTDSEDEYKAALVQKCAAMVRGLIDDGEAGDREPRKDKPGPTPLRTVFTGSHG